MTARARPGGVRAATNNQDTVEHVPDYQKTARPAPDHNETAKKYYEHGTGQRVNTDTIVVEALRAEYPQLHLSVVPRSSCDLFAYCASGNASIVPIDKEKDRLSWRMFAAPSTRLHGERGALFDNLKFGKHLLDWQSKEYVVIYADGRDGDSPYGVQQNFYVLSASVDALNKLVLEASIWNNELHNEIWVFDGGRWLKSRDLYTSVMKSRWEDVILDPKKKENIISDTAGFFDSQATYDKLQVPWKRGIIYYGPPGNGKTISIKAMMHQLFERKDSVPTLYVKTLASFAGPEYSINAIFAKARETAPCYLVFEDLDSIVTDNVRSYFLNAVDGLAKNEGVLMVGSTNHLDRLDPGIAKRPSRFDRKIFFDNPNEAEREQYMHFWQRKLSDNDDIDFPDNLCPAIAKITGDFSFAYLQEVMVASLLAIARRQGEEDGSTDKAGVPARYFAWLDVIDRIEMHDGELDDLVLWKEVKKQVRILREEMDEGKDATLLRQVHQSMNAAGYPQNKIQH